jgi:D-sedoheptulose 7-phosphate isomerase
MDAAYHPKREYEHFTELSAALFSIDREEVHKAVTLLKTAQERGNFVWIVGNGGSAATAEHFANDLVKMCRVRAIAIPAQTPTVTAYGNDDGWGDMFLHALDVFQSPDDVLVAISCSGRSENVVRTAKGIQNLIVMTGGEYQDNELARLPAAACIGVSHEDITIVEDIHLAICHCIAKVPRK